ncbi:MAG TPA: hypothetical protein VJP85_14675 [Candidatus Baltobacteraceae bacterium]|nr:hypothetical protein [Candidatus Baltobacteraceae bacterium]
MRRTIATTLRRAGSACTALALTMSVTCASIAQEKPPATFGDLTHLQFTATSGLRAAFVSPRPQEASPIGATQVVASTVAGAGIELQANGSVIPYQQLGKRTINAKTGETQYFFYGVRLQPGPNTLTIVPLGADGLRGTPVNETVFGPGEPASIYADFASAPIADGKTVVPVRIWIRDRYGNAADPGSKLQLTILRGDARICDRVATAPQATPDPGNPLTPNVRATGEDANPPSAQTVEEPIEAGAYAQIEILPGTRSGALELQIDAGAAHLRKTFYIEPFVRAPFVNGVVSLGTGAVVDGVDGDGIADSGGARRVRAAIYASGKVGRNSLFTAAYESQNRLSPVSSYGPFVQDPNERPYQTYGDASSVSSPLHSADRVYARLENGRNSLTWGQFNAQVGSGDAGAYRQLLSGAKAELHDKNDRVALAAFTARNDMAFVSQVFPVAGLATLMQQLHAGIVVGSEYLQLVALDRHSGAVISELPLVRNVDYTIDYATGVLRFLNVPLPYDAAFNPQVIQLQYQYEGPGVVSQTTGASLDVNLGQDRATQLHMGYVNDATGTQNFAILSQALSRRWNGGTWEVSHASSYGFLPNPGNPFPAQRGGDALALRVNAHTALDSVEMDLQSTGAGFSNPFGGLSMAGLLAYHASLTHTVPRRVSVTLTADGQSNNGSGISDAEGNQSMTARWFATPQLALLGGLVRHWQHSGAAASPQPGSPPAISTLTQTQAQLGVEYKAGKRVGITVTQFQTLSGSDAGSTQPSQTLAQLSYDMSGRGRAYLRELWSAAPTTTFANASSGITYGTGATHSMQLGIERALSPATTVSSDYVVSGTGSATNVYSALGVQERFRLSKYVGGNLLAQSANAIGAGAQGFTVLGGALHYANAQTLQASLAYQARTGFAGGATLSAGIAGHATPDLAVVGVVQRAYSASARSIDDKVSLAYRPLENDRFISLVSYERSNGGFWNGGAASVVSLEELLRPSTRLEIGGRFAYKLDGDEYYRAHTSLTGVRLRQTIGSRLDAGAEVRFMQVPGVSGARSTDFATEAGYSAGQTRFALGYNFSGSADPTLTGKPQRRGVYFTVTTLVDRIFGWGKPQR